MCVVPVPLTYYRTTVYQTCVCAMIHQAIAVYSICVKRSYIHSNIYNKTTLLLCNDIPFAALTSNISIEPKFVHNVEKPRSPIWTILVVGRN